MKQLFMFFALAALLPAAAQAQSVGIGTATPHASAALDVRSPGNNQGLLPPRLTQAQRDAIANPATGLLVYNLDTRALNAWDGARWQEVLGTGAGGSAGNAAPATTTYGYTGSPQTYTVPAGVTQIQVVADGAGSGWTTSNAVFRQGARVSATLDVLPGEVLTVEVGQSSDDGSTGALNSSVTPYNGGGSGSGGFQVGNVLFRGMGGGGATDLRRASALGSTGDYLASRNALLVAGGAGGSTTNLGGTGGIPNGADGASGSVTGGTGATQAGPGIGNGGGANGTGPTGGNGRTASFAIELSGGGGGGYYGGGGGGAVYRNNNGSAGGGGSSWAMPGAANVSYALAPVQQHGRLTITPVVLPAPTFSVANLVGGWQLGAAGLYYQTGNVGIGTSSPQAALHVAGSSGTANVRLSSLAGAGTRLVTADATGNLTATAPALQTGTVSIGSNGGDFKTLTVTFPAAYASAPNIVVCSVRNEAGSSFNDTFAVTVRSVSATGFVVNIRREDGGGAGWGQNPVLCWLAQP
ncbi:hypothetical protein EJV47_06140 [Hymenobacter gummosus]|uniref:receptor protein-tyrosine kinase n=1 Tax=Hymenobacter gummosus TaxID=1776032 RepID=A0A3S0JBM1_9BACT|nr:glycine rich domain-containing protein [Hymenobacter gummosus]RTQ51382.1 hypothetical protein EJV47_06140 [Hymenobacter gummosus]